MPTPVITALPATPSRADPANFAARGDAFLGALPAFVAEPNALAADLTTKAATADTQGTNATTAAAVASNARDAALGYRDSAYGYANSAAASAGTATTKAAEAAASAAAASAVTGIPSTTGHATQTLRVKADGSGLEWVITGDALGFVPVQQGGGGGQLANKIYIGWAGNGLKAQVDASDIGWIPFSSTATGSGTITFAQSVIAPSFAGSHSGNGSGLTGLTGAQINTALSYVPANAAYLAPGAVLEVGRYLDFHAVNSANDYDARLACGVPPGGTGSSELRLEVGNGGRFSVAGSVDATYYTGSGQYLTGLTSAQIAGALGYTPVNQVGPALSCVASADLGGSPAAGVVPTVTGAGTSNHAFMSFLRPSAYGINFGLGSDNGIYCGGYSQGTNTYRFSSDASGNFTALGNLTSTSDIRFKTELAQLKNVVKRLCAIDKGGMRYLDTRTGEHKYGVSAQGVQKHFPDAVVADALGHLSVAYGQLALAALIEVTREFRAKFDEQERRLSRLEERV